jgi:hypothetical protein
VHAGPAGLIAETVLRDDVADFLRFRAACTGWRRCSAHLSAQGATDRRFHPRRWGWIMLPNAFNVRFRRLFRNVRTGERALLDIPDIHRCYVLGDTSEGLLLVCRTDTYAVQLLNPLTGQIAELPHAATLLGTTTGRVDSQVRDLTLRSAGLVDDDDGYTVVLHFEDLVLAVAKPGGESWTRLRFQNKIMAALPFAGRIYCATAKNVSVVRTMPNEPPQLVRVAGHNLDTRVRMETRLFLVDNGGELLLSYCAPYNYEEPPPTSNYDSDDEEMQAHFHRTTPPTFMAYQVKLDTGMIEPLGRLDGQALFIGASCSLVVSVGVSPSIKADTVYFCRGRLALDLLGGNVDPGLLTRGMLLMMCRVTLVDREMGIFVVVWRTRI